MLDPKENIVNTKAKTLSNILIGINLMIYFILYFFLFLIEYTPPLIQKYSEFFIYCSYISFGFSLLIVSIFKTVPSDKKAELKMWYFALFMINALIAWMHYGLYHMFDVHTFG